MSPFRLFYAISLQLVETVCAKEIKHQQVICPNSFPAFDNSAHFIPIYQWTFSFFLLVFLCFRYLSWLWLVFEKPSKHTCIETKELLLIENSLGSAHQKYVTPNLTNTPWKSFFTSMPCYAIFVANFCRSWNFYLLVIFQTDIFKYCFHAKLTEVSIKQFYRSKSVVQKQNEFLKRPPSQNICGLVFCNQNSHRA